MRALGLNTLRTQVHRVPVDLLPALFPGELVGAKPKIAAIPQEDPGEVLSFAVGLQLPALLRRSRRRVNAQPVMSLVAIAGLENPSPAVPDDTGAVRSTPTRGVGPIAASG